MRKPVTEGAWFHDTTEHYYQILTLALQESTLTPVVVYQDMVNNTVWTRPVAEFFDGRFTRKDVPHA